MRANFEVGSTGTYSSKFVHGLSEAHRSHSAVPVVLCDVWRSPELAIQGRVCPNGRWNSRVLGEHLPRRLVVPLADLHHSGVDRNTSGQAVGEDTGIGRLLDGEIDVSGQTRKGDGSWSIAAANFKGTRAQLLLGFGDAA